MGFRDWAEKHPESITRIQPLPKNNSLGNPKICIGHGLMPVKFDYCPYCGEMLYTITQEQLIESWKMSKEEAIKYIKRVGIRT